MPQTDFIVPSTAFDCICGCRPKGCVTMGEGKTEYHIEHFGCRMNTIRFASERAAVHEWNRIVQIKLADIQSTSGSAEHDAVSSNRHSNQRTNYTQ